MTLEVLVIYNRKPFIVEATGRCPADSFAKKLASNN
jgi:hypothetical protein